MRLWYYAAAVRHKLLFQALRGEPDNMTSQDNPCDECMEASDEGMLLVLNPQFCVVSGC